MTPALSLVPPLPSSPPLQQTALALATARRTVEARWRTESPLTAPHERARALLTHLVFTMEGGTAGPDAALLCFALWEQLQRTGLAMYQGVGLVLHELDHGSQFIALAPLDAAPGESGKRRSCYRLFRAQNGAGGAEPWTCGSCFDQTFPPESEAEAKHRYDVRLRLAAGEQVSLKALWDWTCTGVIGSALASAHTQEEGEQVQPVDALASCESLSRAVAGSTLEPILSKALPVAIHRSGILCLAARDAEHLAQLEAAAPEVRRLFQALHLPVISYRALLASSTDCRECHPAL